MSLIPDSVQIKNKEEQLLIIRNNIKTATKQLADLLRKKDSMDEQITELSKKIKMEDKKLDLTKL